MTRFSWWSTRTTRRGGPWPTTSRGEDSASTHTALGQDALDLAHAGRLRAAIVDVTLRDMSGHALVSRLKEIDPRVHVLMTTGDYRPEFEVRARQIGILHYAQKPADPERLEAVVAKALGVVQSR